MGELYIGGVGVGKGYYNMPDKTEEVYLEINNIPYYRSGDYAIELPDGDIDIKGRIDNQIKLRGLRIEIGEIESSINKFKDIKNAVVVIKEINNNDHLCAYFTAEKEIDKDSLKEFLKERLTYYMVPTVFMQLDEIPQLPNGKTDTKKLPEPKLELENVKPENETEQKLFDITSELIETDEFGTTDDLYAIGYTSLTLMKLNTLIYKEMDVNLDISILFNSPTIKKLADEILDGADNASKLNEFVEMSKTMEYFPLTENQLGVYYECMQSPGEIKYTMPSVARFDNEIDAEKLKETVIKVIETHPYLKTRIVLADDGTIKQYRNDDAEIDEIEIVKVDSISDEEIIKNDVKAFSLDNEQMFRFKIYDANDETVLFSDFHHIITDGASQGLLFEEIGKAYNNEETEAEIVDGYVFSLIESDLQNSERYQTAKKFFDDKLSDEIESTVLTPDLNGNPEDGKQKTATISIDISKIDEFCLENSIGHNSVVMSAIMLNLNKFTFSDETLITTIFNGRADPNYFNTQGFLVKTLPLIIKHKNREQTIEDFIKSVDKTWIESINSSIYPYTKIAGKYQLKPEFFYSYDEGSSSESLEMDGKDFESYELDEDNGIMEYKIDLNVFKHDTAIEIGMSYNDQLYSEGYIETFLNSTKSILDQFVGNDFKTMRICDVELETAKELPTFTPVETPFLHKRFEKQVESKPDKIALVSNGEDYTYKELNELSNRVANGLIKRGVEPRNNVLVMLPRNSDMIASILGVLKAGCAYIPIDLEYPQERIDYIYENSQADYIISNETKGNSLDIKELLEEENIENPDVEITPDDLAYMIYTSGSTGNPKGVMISHENICNQVQNPKSQYESLLCLATVSFDVSVDDMLTSLSNGLKLIFASDTQIKSIPELIELIGKEKPEVSEITPSRLASYLEVPEFCEVISCLKCVFLGGEQFSATVYENFRKHSDAIVYNSYGPTETTITSNNKEVTDVNDITVGLPLENYVTDVRDIDGKLLPQGVMGELYIGGISVGKGYYNMPDKTEEVFLTINDIPYYRSGDYAIEKPNGEIDIQGRIDNQIKLRGLRIEIGEIESNINKFDDIKNAVVVIKEINDNDHLCAYFTAEKEIDKKSLKEFLKERLTYYMVPTVFMQLDELPQTPNGKTDIKELPEPKLELENIKPENETEQKLFDIASELIETDEFGTTDDLYAIGYTSLTLMKLNTLIYREMNVNLDISILFNSPTIKKLAAEILGSDDNASKLNEFVEMSKTMEYFPLTENQLGIYYECMQSPGEIKYTMPSVTKFDDEIDAEKLKETVIKVIETHPYLKTRIVSDDGSIKQYRNDDVEIDEIEIVKVDSITDDEIIKNDVKAFALDGEQMFRFKIYDAKDETVLFSDFHHIITDGASQSILFEEIGKTYNNEDIDEEIVDGYVFSLIENDLQNSEKYEAAEKYFDDKLSQEIDSTVLTPDLNGNPEDGKQQVAGINIDITQIDEFCLENSIGHNSLVMSAVMLNLNKFTFSDKTLITTIFNGRADPNYFNTQGFLVKTMPLIVKHENREQTIEEFIKSVDKTWIDSINSSIYPYTKIADKYQLKPEFFYSYDEGSDSESLEMSGNDYENYELDDGNGIMEYKIDFSVFRQDTDIEISISYNDQLYSKGYIETFLESIETILDQIVSNDFKTMRICDVELETTKELPTFTPLETPFLHKRFEKQVEAKPDEIALISNKEEYTYRELNELSNRVANGLIKRGVKPRHNVLIMLPRTSDLIASIIGILKAGCGFIPIDMEYPQERIDYIYENSQADYIISNETQDNTLDIKELLEEENIENPDVEISPDDTAYMIYTSGSTGKPKGVMIGHENACNETEANPKAEYDNLLSIATIAFDTSLEDILTGITNGIKIIFANDTEIKNVVDLIYLIKREKPQVMEFTPSRPQTPKYTTVTDQPKQQ